MFQNFDLRKSGRFVMIRSWSPGRFAQPCVQSATGGFRCDDERGHQAIASGNEVEALSKTALQSRGIIV